MFAEFPLTSARTNCAPVTPDIFQSGTKFGFRAQRKMSREGIVGARFRKGKCPSPAKLRRQTCHLWHSQMKLCAWALGHLRLCRARSPFLKKLNGKELPEQERRLVGPANSCLSPCRETTRFWGPRRSFNFYRWPLT